MHNTHPVRGGSSRRRARAFGLAAIACAAGGALAQATPPQVLPNVQQLAPQPERPSTDATRLPASPAAAVRELARPADDLQLDVAGYELDGGPPELQAALADLTAPFTGPGRRYEDLVRAANAVTVFLQSRLGRYLGYAYLPEQKPQGGRIRIAVLEGRLDRVQLDWAEGLAVDREVVEAYLARLRPGQVLLIDEVERIVFLVNDLRGMAASFEFREGREFGTATLVVTARAERRVSHRLDLDTDGSRFTGVERLGWQTAIDSPAGRGDGLTLGAQVSRGGGLAFGLAGYTLPVGSDGLKLGLSLSAFRYRFDPELMPQDVNGTALAGSAYALYPWLRSRNRNLFVLASLDHKRFSDRQGDVASLDVRKHTDELRLGLTGDFRDDWLSGGVNTHELSLTLGRVVYDRNAPLFSDDSARIAKLGGSFTRLQNIVDARLLLYLNLRGQQALRNLDATQQFRLGGADGVRAFAAGERAGDSGQLLSTELRMLPPADWLGGLGRELVFSVFHDIGRIRLRQDLSERPAGFDNGASLAGAGIGVAWERPREFNLRVYLSKPLSGTPTSDTARRDPRVYAQFSWQL